jgi:hypothetical protein
MLCHFTLKNKKREQNKQINKQKNVSINNILRIYIKAMTSYCRKQFSRKKKQRTVVTPDSPLKRISQAAQFSLKNERKIYIITSRARLNSGETNLLINLFSHRRYPNPTAWNLGKSPRHPLHGLFQVASSVSLAQPP